MDEKNSEREVLVDGKFPEEDIRGRIGSEFGGSWLFPQCQSSCSSEMKKVQ